jgi:hypothetical protein
MTSEVYWYAAMVASFGVGYFWGSSNGFKKGYFSAIQKIQQDEMTQAFFNKMSDFWSKGGQDGS